MMLKITAPGASEPPKTITAPATPTAITCIEKIKNPYQGNSEALGWALDGIARVIVFISAAVFLSTALINLAKMSVGCSTEIPEGSIKAPDCNKKIYGIKPSSILTTYATVVGLVVAITLPFVGALLDHTRHRKTFGGISALVQVFLVFVLCFLSENNWFTMAIIQVLSSICGWVHTLAIFAYLPELTNDPTLLVKWTANFHLLQYVAMVLFIPMVVGAIHMLMIDGDEIMSAKLAIGAAFVISAILFGWTWTSLIQPRSALQTLPEGSSLLTIGFLKIWRTGKELFHRHTALMWFFINVSLVEAGQSSLSVISLTYMTDKLQLNGAQNGIVIFILFIFASFGTGIGQVSIKYMDPIRSNQLCQLFTVGATTTALFILTGPGQQFQTFLIASLWGIAAGWKTTVERFAITQLIPKGQDAEMMGFYLFASQVLVWCPTLIFTTLNEAGCDQRIGLGMLNVFFLGGFICLSLMGSYDKARQVAMSNQNPSIVIEHAIVLEEEVPDKKD